MYALKKLVCVWLTISIFSPVLVFPMQQVLEKKEKLDNFTVLFAPGVDQSKKDLEGYTRDDIREAIEHYKWSEEEINGHLNNNRNVLANAWEKVFLKKVKAVNFPNIVTEKHHDDGLVTFGQKSETDVLEAEFKKEKATGKKVLVAGNSRGGFVALNGNFEGAAGIFVQSTVGSLKDIVDNFCLNLGFAWVPGLGRFIHRFAINSYFMPMFRFRGYDPNGPKPIDMVGRIPKDMPIFIACTADDSMMPESSSAKLVEKLIETGHTKVYFYRGYGWHTCMYKGVAPEDSEKYANTVHAFMKEIGLLDKNFDCKDGEAELNKCKVTSLDEIRKVRKDLEDKEWNRSRDINKIVFGFAAVATALTVGTFFIGKKLINKYRASKLPIKKSFIQGLVAKFVPGFSRA